MFSFDYAKVECNFVRRAKRIYFPVSRFASSVSFLPDVLFKLFSLSGVTQEMHLEGCIKVPVCKFVLDPILLCITRVLEDDQRHTKLERRLQQLLLYFMCQSRTVLCSSCLFLNLYIFKMVTPFCH